MQQPLGGSTSWNGALRRPTADISTSTDSPRPALAGKVLVPVLGQPYGGALVGGEIELRFDPATGSLSFWHYEHRFPLAPVDYPAVLQAVARTRGRRAGAAGGGVRHLREADGIEGAGGGELPSSDAWRNWRGATARWRDAAWSPPGVASRTRPRASPVSMSCCSASPIGRPIGASPPTRSTIAVSSTSATSRAPDGGRGASPPAQTARRAHRRWPDPRAAHRSRGWPCRPRGILSRSLSVREGAPCIGCRRGGIHSLYIGREDPGPPRAAASCLKSGESAGSSATGARQRCLCRCRGRRSAGADLAKLHHRLPASVADETYRCKRGVIDSVYLHRRVRGADQPSGADHPRRRAAGLRLRAALWEIAAAFPVYRTYVTERGIDEADVRDIVWAVQQAKKRWIRSDGRGAGLHPRGASWRSPRRGPNTTRPASGRCCASLPASSNIPAPVTAKGMEDTAFYRYFPLLVVERSRSRSAPAATSLEAFHRGGLAARERNLAPRHARTAATHDTKRGEDVRARLNVLSEVPRRVGAAHRALAQPQSACGGDRGRHGSQRERRVSDLSNHRRQLADGSSPGLRQLIAGSAPIWSA